jgi:hypothetical protein
MANVASAESVQDMLFLLHAGAAKGREFLIWRRWLPLSTPAKNFAKKWLDSVFCAGNAPLSETVFKSQRKSGEG